MGYIKQITIQGFKSYKDQTQIEPFSPKSNVIVGRNGSGKSNFFAAVRFVLGDDYHFLNREERQALLHEGSGSAVMSAYVEVCFDNTEDRFQTGKPEFYLRRTIGAKKDEYSVNRKNATKAEVQQILESAGFSRSNPYYIVPQGRVTALTNMRDSERLTLLKEISGSNVYETRRADSLKLLADTDHKCNSIDELVASINERLSELEGEKEELEAWSKNDRERRSLIYTMKQREESELEAKLEQIDALEHNGREIRENNEALFRQNEEDMAQIESEINQLKGDLELLQDERAQYEADRKEATLAKAKVELELEDLTEGQSVAQKAKKRRDAAIRNLQQQIQTRESELQQLLPEYAAKKEQEDAIRSQLLEAESHRKRLEEKQGRTAFYSNKQQRDKALRDEINNTNMDLSRRKAVLSQTNDEIDQLNSDIERLQREIADLKTSIESEGDNTLNLATQLQQARDAKQALHDEQRGLERELSKIDSEMVTAQAQLRTAESTFSRLLPADTRFGLDSLRRYQKKNNLTGLHGTIADLFQVPEAYKNVVESAAEGALFQVVVDNHNVSSKIIDMLNKDRGGRLTFIPLKQMQIRDTEVKTEPDMQPLLPKLTYDPAYDVAFKHVFGKVVVCPNLATCRSKANQYGVHAYTADGDSATQKGRYRGGYRDPSKSQLDAYSRVTQYRAVLDELQKNKDEIIRKLDSKRQELTAATTEVRKRERERDTGESSYGPMRAELRAKENQLLESRNQLASKQRNAAEIESGINLLGDHQSDLEAEITSEFRKALSTDEEQMLVTLASTVKDLRQQAYRLTEERARLESKKADLELELHQNLRPSLDELLAQSTGAGSTTSQSARLKECERSLQAVTQNIADFNQKIQEIDDRIEETRGQLSQLEASRTEKESSNRDLARALEKHEKIMSRKNQDRNMLTERLTAVKRDIRDLGTVPEDAHHKYDRWDTKKISDRLTKVNQAQKKFAHVNKKAFEQYESFTKQRKTLTDRRNELDSSRKSIENLIEVLDQRKDDAIARTFRQVSRAFKDVFKQLVPIGAGRLIIQRRSDAEARQEDDESENEGATRATRNRATVENYTGVGIAVSFNSEHDEQQRISQLSGGQKSLCAMALIFAIQQCDPAPFYLFDEIDANLDAQYRTAVASMLEKLSGKGGAAGDGGGQFICTTFRPEMVLVADKCYGVNYSNKTSSIDVVSRDDALQFVDSTQKT